MKDFNKKITMDSRVFYQSWYTTMHNAADDKMFSFTYSYIREISGDNDGLVSERSAKWGDNVTKIEGRISHAQILDYKAKEIDGIHIPDIYLKIVKGLSEQHF